MPNTNDVAVRYSATSGDRGIYLYTGGAWVKQTAPTTYMITKAWPDVCRATLAEADGGFVGGPYGTVNDYIGTGVNFLEVLAIQTAFINKLFAQYIKVQTGGSIRGGDRYDEDGATIDSTVDGFFIGASGACKVAGITFEGSQGGGVQWTPPVSVGAPAATGGIPASITALTNNSIVIADSSLGTLRTWVWDGNTWEASGNAYTGIPTISVAAYVTRLADDAFAYIDYDGYLRYFEWDGTDWGDLGGNILTDVENYGRLTALSPTLVALFENDSGTGTLHAYSWSGTAWSEVGTAISVPSTRVPGIATLGPNLLAICGATGPGSSNYFLSTYLWNGSTFVLQGNSLALSNASFLFCSLSALNGTDIIMADDGTDLLYVYRWDGTNWALVTQTLGTFTGTFTSRLSAVSGTSFVMNAVVSSVDSLVTFIVPSCLAAPYRP